jgi:hypothetical protein
VGTHTQNEYRRNLHGKTACRQLLLTVQLEQHEMTALFAVWRRHYWRREITWVRPRLCTSLALQQLLSSRCESDARVCDIAGTKYLWHSILQYWPKAVGESVLYFVKNPLLTHIFYNTLNFRT